MNPRRFLHIYITWVFLILFGSLGSAQHKFYTTSVGGDLYLVDPDQCTANFIGNSGATFFDIARCPSTGVMYAVNSNGLFKVDTTDAVATLVAYSWPLMNALVCDSVGNLFGASGLDSELYQIDTATGAATSLGIYSLVTKAAGDLMFWRDSLYLTTKLNTIIQMDVTNVAGAVSLGIINGIVDVYGLVNANTICTDYVFGSTSNDVYTLTGGNLLNTALICPNIVPNDIYGMASAQNTYSQPQVNMGSDTVLCTGETILLNVYNPNSSYMWQDGSTNSTYLVSSPGTYTVEVNDSCFTYYDTIVVGYDPLPVVELGNDTTICGGQPLILNVATSNASYLWQDNSTGPTMTITQAGTYWVTVTVNNCSTTDIIIVSVNTIPTLNLGGDTSLCDGETIFLDAFNTNCSYIWQDSTFNSSYQVSQSGTYWVQVSDGCYQYSDTIVITYNPFPLVSLPNDTLICIGDSLILDVLTVNASYIWQDNSTSPTLTVTQAGTYWVTVTVNNCSTTDSIQVGTDSLPMVELGNDTMLCWNESIIFFTNPSPGTYLWQDGSSGLTMPASLAGDYWLEISTLCKTVSDTVSLNYVQLLPIDLGADTILCQGDTLVLDVSANGGSYIWQDGSLSSTMIVISAGTYWIETTVAHCQEADTIQINFEALPTVSLGEPSNLCVGSSFTLEAINANASYTWQDGSSQPTFEVSEEGTYWVKVVTSCGTVSDTVTVNAIDCGCLLCIPDAFTPNGSGLNENNMLYIFSKLDGMSDFVESIDFKVFNRWGEKIFHATDKSQIIYPEGGWDGNHMKSGLKMEIGVYVWTLKAQTVEGRKIGPIGGNVTLLR
ncbi:MAG TPA: hypothetical protein EYN38_08120 [Flavobacteriales bacterium]|nr:hypothetical protein [Flavobacteriales bacterium]HIO73051.1 hypothetical protein [Flavobacteriales bacterium]